MADIVPTLLKAQQADRTAEAQLEKWVKENYGEFIKALARDVIADDSKDFTARQLACLVIKNSLYGKTVRTQTDLHNRWKQLDRDTRSVVKEGLLTAMRSGDQRMPGVAAIAAAEVACVELPFQEWPEFVPSLTDNIAQAAAPVIQHGGLKCFGFTLERIAEVEELIEVSELPTETVDKILTSIVSCVHENKPDQLRLEALKALKNSLLFVRKNMEVKEERDFIMKNAIMAATRAEHVELRCLAYGCLDQVADLYYENLKDYMTEIFQLTTTSIRSDPEEPVKVAAIEFWSTVAVVEQGLQDEELMARELNVSPPEPGCQKYTQLALGQLVPLLLETLTTQDEDGDDDEIGLDSTGSVCLETISQTVEGAIIPLVMPFVQQNINHDNWHFRDAAIVAFAGILDGPSTESVQSFVSESINRLIEAFQDAHETVRQSAVHCISTICRLHVGAIASEQVTHILQAVMEKLKETPRVAAYACTAIYNIARSLKNTNGEPTNVLSQAMYPLLNALFQVSDRSDCSENNLRGNSMEAAAELIAASALDSQPILVQVLPEINRRTQGALAMPVVSQDDGETKTQLLSSLCIIYNALFQRLSKHEVAPAANQIMENLLKILQIQNISCQEDVFMAIGGLASILEEGFTNYLQAVMPLVASGIRNYEAVSFCSVSIGLLVDICGAVSGAIQPYCDNLVATLKDLLHDTAVDRSLKPAVISSLGDIAMAICGAFEPYLSMTSMLLMQAAQQNPPQDNEDLIEFINTLRSAVLEAYSGILLGLSDGKKLNLIVPHIQQICLFLEWLANPASLRDDAVLVKAATLLGDIAKEVGKEPQVKATLAGGFAMQLLAACAQEGGDEGASTANWAHGQLVASAQ